MPLILVSVTAQHLRDGERYSDSDCPVALALKSAGMASPSVGLGGIGPSDGDDFAPTPLAVRRKISAFDGGEKVEPFSFTLRIPKKFMAAKS